MKWAFGAAGAVLGALAAAIGLWAGQAPSSPATEVDVTTTAVVEEVEPAGPVTLGPTRLVPRALALDGREVVFSYELVDEAPPAGPTVFLDADVPVVAPELWTLSTVVGPIVGTTAGIGASTARFVVPEGFTLDQVAGITLESYRMRFPLRIDLDLAWDDVDPISIDSNVSVAVRRILEQASSTLVQLTVDDHGDPFAAAGGAFGARFEAGPRIAGRGRGWTNIGPVTGGVQLTFVGDLPDPFPITVATTTWTRVTRPVTIAVGGLADE